MSSLCFNHICTWNSIFVCFNLVPSWIYRTESFVLLYGLWFTCGDIINIKRHGFYQAINQVHTLLCNQSCWLYVKFMQHCCNWTVDDLFMWHHLKWTFDHLHSFNAIKPLNKLVHSCAIELSILELIHANQHNWIAWLLVRATSLQWNDLYLWYIVMQDLEVVLTTTNLFIVAMALQ